MLAARDRTTFSVVVLTDSPSFNGVVQAAWIFGIPSISTRHIRHCPTTERRGWKQKCGISMPASLAASIRLTFFGTSIGLPSKRTVKVSLGGGGGGDGGGAPGGRPGNRAAAAGGDRRLGIAHAWTGRLSTLDSRLWTPTRHRFFSTW